ncbi:SDR family NAD(P)-dependent oxidoreductase [Roseixanthobacter glucoisosaccharinicivorans]|uniref:SDR family NAD(P)-dependent oxidoreductase n=1 Tax=Roseixanthobacter glucoisosaccharinicivorans TaxID=3119923 RepID=UPI00372630FD
MGKLSGKVAVVTGASKGIGAAIAKSLAAEGASVAVNYASSKEGADRVVAEITAAGGKAVAVQGDVAKAADVARLFAETKAAFGGLDILVNNAGVYTFASIEEVNEEHFHRQFDTNVLGLLLATREAVKLFPAEGGSIVNISSAATALSLPTASVYTATKAAVESITRTLANELGPRNIRVNAISPGGVDTEGTRAIGMIGSDMEKQFIAKTPLGRGGQPQDIASVAAFLVSVDAGWLTGEILFASGGLR